MSTLTSVATSSRPRGRARRIVVWVGAILVVLLLAAYLGIGAMAANILTTPARDFSTAITPANAGLTYEDVRLPARGGDVQLAAWYVPSDSSRRAVVLVHGKDGSRTADFNGGFMDLAAALHKRGLAVLMIDLRGHGQSDDAHFSFGINERRDIEGAVDWLMARQFPPGSIGVFGVSMGAAASVGATADDGDVGALVIDSGYADIQPIIQSNWNTASGLPDAFLPGMLLMHRLMYGFDIAASRPVDEIGRVAPRPILIIHGTADQLVPFDNAMQLKAKASSAQLWEVAGVDHAGAYTQDPQTYREKVADFFAQQLK
jgi:uncharacterized protein